MFPITYYLVSYYLLPCFLLRISDITVFPITEFLITTELTISGKIKTPLVLHVTMKFEAVTVCIITFTLYFQRVRCLPPNPLATEYNLGKYKYLSINFTLYIWKYTIW